jgi:MEDS: MEthanogen/methylotroph, DcmR Sensory domain
LNANYLRTNLCWSEMAPSEHLVQIYGEDDRFLDALEGFVCSGLRNDEGVIVIATASHLHHLEQRLRAEWLDPDRARYEQRYIPMLASETLARFMVDGWPDGAIFASVATEAVARARGAHGRKVRAFGEMVALLWSEGKTEAALRLEHLWHKVIEREQVPLFCAYPRDGFKKDAASMHAVCAAHSKVVPA